MVRRYRDLPAADEPSSSSLAIEIKNRRVDASEMVLDVKES